MNLLKRITNITFNRKKKSNKNTTNKNRTNKNTKNNVMSEKTINSNNKPKFMNNNSNKNNRAIVVFNKNSNKTTNSTKSANRNTNKNSNKTANSTKAANKTVNRNSNKTAKTKTNKNNTDITTKRCNEIFKSGAKVKIIKNVDEKLIGKKCTVEGIITKWKYDRKTKKSSSTCEYDVKAIDTNNIIRVEYDEIEDDNKPSANAESKTCRAKIKKDVINDAISKCELNNCSDKKQKVSRCNKLYRKASIDAHPDKNIECQDYSTEIFQKLKEKCGEE